MERLANRVSGVDCKELARSLLRKADFTQGIFIPSSPHSPFLFQVSKMKKLLILTALFGFSASAMMGCGSGAPAVVEETSEDDGSMDAAQQAQYEQMMKSGGGTSSRPGN